MTDEEWTARISYLLTYILLGVEVWAVAKWVSIPVGLGFAVYLLKQNYSERKP